MIKDRSIFRKNIGRAILNKNNDSFLEIWNLDFTTGDEYYLSCDLNGVGHISKDVPEYCSIFSKQFNCQNDFWKFGKEFMSIPKEYMQILFDVKLDVYSKIKINFSN